MRRFAAILGLMAFAGAGCSVVKHARVSDDWETVDRARVKRLVVLTHPLPAGLAPVGEMWSAIAARHVDLKREFIIKARQARGADEGFEPRELCAPQGEDGEVEGVLWLRPEVTRRGSGVEAALWGALLRCVDGEEVWSASAAGSWNSADKRLTQTITDYTKEFGPEVEPYVAASWHLLRAALDTLPQPVLAEEDQLEKIEYGQ
jgi:probable lipoprotein (TIGR04455 family)